MRSQQRLAIIACIAGVAFAVGACASTRLDLNIKTQEHDRAIRHGRTLYDAEGIILASTILTECRVRMLKASHDDSERIAEKSQPLGYTVVDPQTAATWTRQAESELIKLPARTRFLVIGEVSFRCALPGMTVSSPDDGNLNGNEDGKDGTFYRIRILQGAFKSKLALWIPDDTSTYADTRRLCIPKEIRSADVCPVGE